MTGLHDQQRAVVEHVRANRTTVVGAGAGVGKTRVLVASVEELITAGARIDQFAIISFTNAAAEEVRSRISAAMQARALSDPRWSAQQERVVGTFTGTIHSYALTMLQTYGYELLTARNTKTSTSLVRRRQAIVDALELLLVTGGQDACLQEMAIENYELVQLAGNMIDACESQGLAPARMAEATRRQPADSGKIYRVAFAELLRAAEEAYEAEKAHDGLLDASDLLGRLATLLHSPSSDQVAAAIAARWPYLFVDEFQDTDVVQYRILRRLEPHVTRLLVVGDPKQAVYGWRAANPRLLARLAQDCGVRVLPLRTANRPQTRILLRAQNALFHGMRGDHPTLDEPLEEPTDLPATDPPDRLDPIEWLRVRVADAPHVIAGHIRSLLGRALPGSGRDVLPGDIVILVRSNKRGEEMARAVDDALGLSSAPVRFERGESLFSTPPVIGTYRMLRLLLDPRRNINVALALRTPYLVNVELDEVVGHTILNADPAGHGLADALAGRYPDVEAKIRSLSRAIRTRSAPEILADLYDSFSIYERYRSLADEVSCEHLDLFRETARNLFYQQQALTLPIFVDYVENAIVTGRVDVPVGQGAVDLPPPHIRVMTVHRAKGLQFPIVVIPGMTSPTDKLGDQIEALIDWDESLQLSVPLADGGSTAAPGHSALSGLHRVERIDEEFRIFYVAVTRAQHQVVLVGDNSMPVRRRSQDGYSWRDAARVAWPDVRAVN